MPRMRAPYTGVVFDVHPCNVDERLARGLVLLEPYDHAEPGPEAEAGEPEAERGHEPDRAVLGSPRPTGDSTIAELREWASAHGVALPKRANKDQILGIIGEAGA